MNLNKTEGKEMTYDEFKAKYLGTKVDYDGAYGAQCVDLARQYFKDVWGAAKQPEGVVGAQDFFRNHNNRPIQRELADMVSYRQGTAPPKGAVVIFSAMPGNQYGHIGICDHADSSLITLLEQDGFRQDGVKLKVWNYAYCMGWLLKKA